MALSSRRRAFLLIRRVELVVDVASLGVRRVHRGGGLGGRGARVAELLDEPAVKLAELLSSPGWTRRVCRARRFSPTARQLRRRRILGRRLARAQVQDHLVVQRAERGVLLADALELLAIRGARRRGFGGGVRRVLRGHARSPKLVDELLVQVPEVVVLVLDLRQLSPARRGAPPHRKPSASPRQRRASCSPWR